MILPGQDPKFKAAKCENRVMGLLGQKKSYSYEKVFAQKISRANTFQKLSKPEEGRRKNFA